MRLTVADEKREAAAQLVALGVNEHVVAAGMGLSLSDVKTLHASRSAVETKLSPEDQQLAEAMRGLAWRCYEEAMVTLEYGHPTEKAALVRLVLQRSMGLVGMETTQRFDDLRTEFEKLLESSRLPSRGTNAEPSAPPIDVDYSDEGTDD